jgi:hypothetical protein
MQTTSRKCRTNSTLTNDLTDVILTCFMQGSTTQGIQICEMTHLHWMIYSLESLSPQLVNVAVCVAWKGIAAPPTAKAAFLSILRLMRAGACNLHE